MRGAPGGLALGVRWRLALTAALLLLPALVSAAQGYTRAPAVQEGMAMVGLAAVGVEREAVVVDNAGPGFSATGPWQSSTAGSYHGDDYLVLPSGAQGAAVWEVTVPRTGEYEVQVKWQAFRDRAWDAPYVVDHAGGRDEVYGNQRHEVTWWPLGVFPFQAGKPGRLTLRGSPRGIVTADAVRLVPALPEEEVCRTVRGAVALAGGLEDLVPRGGLVVLKPSVLSDLSPLSGRLTDPRVTRCVVHMVQEAGAGRVVIGEGSGGYFTGDPNRDRHATRAAFRAAGYDLDGDMRDDATGVELVDFNISGDDTDHNDPALVVPVEVRDGLVRKEYWVPRLVAEADLLISIPVLKNHAGTGVTLGMKNLYGIAPNDIYHAPGHISFKFGLSHYGPDRADDDRTAVDLNLVRRPDFVVVDGLRGVWNGPGGTKLAEPHRELVLAGRDVVAVDTVGTLLMGYDPASVVHLDLAARLGLGVGDPARIQVRGASVVALRQDFPITGDPRVARADATPPRLLAVEGAPERPWRGVQRVRVRAEDNTAVARVDLAVDGHWHAASLATPFEFQVDTRLLEPGTHVLTATAYDGALNQAVLHAVIEVAPGEGPDVGGDTSLAPLPTAAAPPSLPPAPWTPAPPQVPGMEGPPPVVPSPVRPVDEPPPRRRFFGACGP